MKSVSKYLSLVKFSHTVFALPFAIIGFFLAVKKMQSTFDLRLFILMLCCMIFARSAAMAFNRFIDRKFDSLNPRTQVREIPSGQISSTAALIFVIISCLGFVVCTWFINPMCFYLSPVALLVVLGYSYTKRFTALCHIILGIGLGLAPIGAYLTITGKFAVLPVLFSFAVLFWVSGFDIIYALQDEDFDRSNKLHSIPAFMGRKNALRLSELLHLFSGLLVLAAGYYGNFHVAYWIGAGLFCFFLIYQHTLVKLNDLSKVNLAFFTMNGIASVVFGVITVVSILISK
ncbi:MAG: UbiA family prenyltransferase [Bacteroidia bacterium]|nr:UbiA family prenyltransferase [Bacteroidia bacterium]